MDTMDISSTVKERTCVPDRLKYLSIGALLLALFWQMKRLWMGLVSVVVSL